jgi:hypothetical protein
MTGAIIYHSGFLAIDRKADEDLDRRATMLRFRADRGEAILTQHRLGPDQWEYVARVKQ